MNQFRAFDKDMTKIQSILLAASFISAGTLSLHADDLADLAAQIKADHAYVLTHPQTLDPEALRLQHDAWMVKDMQERDKEIQADFEATRLYYKKFADAEAKKWQAEKQRQPDTVIVSRGGSSSAGRDNTGYAYASGTRSGEVTEIYHTPSSQ